MNDARVTVEDGEIVLRLRLELPSPPVPAADPGPPVAYKVDEIADFLRIGQSRVYDLIATGELPSVKIGASRRITRAALEAYLARLSDKETAGPE